ncbi:hypothetical protein LJC52_00395 [Bacteroidales bacterium OttesenSCG-928-A17]|nr:hypothetical protein [Bacteroidales bacterium OttesenSCG-928-A17]
MEDKKIKQLLDSYFEGTTSLPEEQYLQDYFRQDSIEPEFEQYRPMFQYFSEEMVRHGELDHNTETVDRIHFSDRNMESRSGSEITKAKSGITKKIRICVSVGAAACLGIFLFLSPLFDSKDNFSDTSIAYVNGKEHTDISTIRAEVLDVLDTMKEENEEIFSSQIELLENLFD